MATSESSDDESMVDKAKDVAGKVEDVLTPEEVHGMEDEDETDKLDPRKMN